MERKYPAKMFLLFVLTNFLFHFFYLSIPGIILCVAGIWVRPCLWIGFVILGLDLVLSIVEQARIAKAAVTPSDNTDFNELMDAFCGPDGLNAVREIVDAKINSSNHTDYQDKNDIVK